MAPSLYKFVILLRYAIGVSDVIPKIENEEWNNIFALAERHSLLGVVFHSVQKGGHKPPKQLLFQWILYSEKIRLLNMKSNEVALKINDES